MKKLLIATSIIACSMSAYSAQAADGQILFTGSITDTACTITNTVATPLTVSLGTISSKAFQSTGSTAAATTFNIGLTECPDTTKNASVKFDGVSAKADNTVLKLTEGTGVAENVGVQIVDATGKVVPLFTSSSSYALSEGENSLQFTARYVSLADTVKAGKADATAQFTIVYN